MSLPQYCELVSVLTKWLSASRDSLDAHWIHTQLTDNHIWGKATQHRNRKHLVILYIHWHNDEYYYLVHWHWSFSICTLLGMHGTAWYIHKKSIHRRSIFLKVLGRVGLFYENKVSFFLFWKIAQWKINQQILGGACRISRITVYGTNNKTEQKANYKLTIYGIHTIKYLPVRPVESAVKDGDWEWMLYTTDGNQSTIRTIICWTFYFV